MVKYREILKQKAMGISVRNIAYSCQCSPSTVETVVNRAKLVGLEWPLPEQINDQVIRELIYPKKSKVDAQKAEIDHEEVDRQMSRPGVTRALLWSEYCERARAAGKEPYMYSAFCQKHREWAESKNVVMHIEHKPAAEMQVDYVGDVMRVVDVDTGELHKVYVFAACLPFSGELYAQGFYDMKVESWIEAHVQAFSFFGGVTPVVVPDNLKQGVTKNTFSELVINDQYRHMAEYYGCAIVPARPRRPRDKGAIEMGVRVIEQQAIAPLRDETFTSLAELNQALLEKIYQINARPFQKRSGSRDEVFTSQEKPYLIPLPGKPYEIITRKIATVNFNYHVVFNKSWYSVPFTYVRREVEICATKSAVWINCDGVRIAMHKRLLGKCAGYSTDPNHMPDTHRDFVEWNSEGFCAWAAQIGPSCKGAIEAILASRTIEQQVYRSCRAVLALAEKYGKQNLEQACEKALSYSPRPSYKTIKPSLQRLCKTLQKTPMKGLISEALATTNPLKRKVNNNGKPSNHR